LLKRGKASSALRVGLERAIKLPPAVELIHAPDKAHVYRKFEEAEPDHPEANFAMGWIADLYAFDERAGDDAERRLELRRAESAAVLAKPKTWLEPSCAQDSVNRKAAAYTIANWERLTRFVDAAVPLDNNGTERGIRGPVVGRKNHYGLKSKRGTEVAALLYSLFETAKLHNVNPTRYLQEAVRAPIAAKRCCLGSSPPSNILERDAHTSARARTSRRGSARYYVRTEAVRLPSTSSQVTGAGRWRPA
jgi:hypothetical protein